MRGHLLFVLLLTLLTGSLLAWISQSRLDDFQSLHRSLAQSATNAAANEIAGFVEEKKRLVTLFAKTHQSLLLSFANDPDDEALHRKLSTLISDFFPNHFSFTVTDAAGHLMVDDFDNMIGEMCRQDLADYSASRIQKPRIHPHPEVYHFDVLSPIAQTPESDILFVSFDANLLGRALGNLQTPDHRLILIDPSASNLIEVVADGARIKWSREDYRLSDEELAQILASTDVPGTAWRAVEMQQQGLLKQYRDSLLTQAALVFVLFIVSATAYLLYVFRNEKRRQQAETYKEEFLSVVSHELRTPLTSIRGSLGLLEAACNEQTGEQTRRLIRMGIKNTERLVTLVNDLLDAQKIQAGKMMLDLQPVAVHELVEQAISNNQSYARQLGSRIVLGTTLEKGLQVMADGEKLHQVLNNLLSNAAKYGAVHDTIIIDLKRMDDQVRISVIDHGDGIPEAFRNRVFSKFAQSDSSDTRSVSGTGLGLSIAKMIVERHKGAIGFDTETGVGTRFHIDLPIHQATDGATAS